MRLLTEELRRAIPPVNSQESVAGQVCRVWFFMPDGVFTWYFIESTTQEKAGCRWDANCHHRPLTEYDPDRDDVLFFGYVIGLEAELGYFTLSELTAVRDMLGLPVERDRYFTPCRLSVAKAGEED